MELTPSTDWTAIKDIAQTISATATTVGIVVGGIWSYLLFVRERLRYPKATLQLQIDHAPVTAAQRLVHVGISIANIGSPAIKLEYAEVRLRQVVPLPDDLAKTVVPGVDPVPAGEAEISWPMIVGRVWKWRSGEFEIEPKEHDTFHADFIIERGIQTIEIYAFVRNEIKKGPKLGWAHTMIFSFGTGAPGGVKP